MCGIAGYFGHRMLDSDSIQKIFDSIQKRGPDSRGSQFFTSELKKSSSITPNALIHTRLAIRDLSSAGAQPMSSVDGSVWITYNGEVYDWEKYAQELSDSGHPLKSRSDTEFILNGYLCWGIDSLLEKLRGMFAFAIFDSRKKLVYLARDRLGLKPLFYYNQSGNLAFGSLLKSVTPYLQHQEKEISKDAIDAFLAHRYIPSPLTIIKSVKKLPAAHYAKYNLRTSALAIHEYWKPSRINSQNSSFNETLIKSIKLRLVSDRPVGLFLSGGIDSATIGSVLAKTGHKDISSYTAAFPNTTFDESSVASKISRELGIENTTIPIHDVSIETLDEIISDLDEPFSDPSAIPLWLLSKETSQHVKVILGGDGGDELFAGYKRYKKHLKTSWRNQIVIPLNAPLKENPFFSKFSRILDEFKMPWIEAYSLRFSGLTPSQRSWLQPELGPAPHTYWRLPIKDHTNTIETLLEVDRLNYLPEYILKKSDLCTASHGLEARLPFLDHILFNETQNLENKTRFSSPPKMLALNGSCDVCNRMDLFNAKKKGFNPPLNNLLGYKNFDHINRAINQLPNLTNDQINKKNLSGLLNEAQKRKLPNGELLWQLYSLSTSLYNLHND